jgi:N-glycosylase/DNA lyase
VNALFDRGVLREATFGPDARRQYWTGREWQLGTASYWETVALGSATPTTYRLGNTLNEEIAACILGGYGMTWDTVQPYLQRVQESGLLERNGGPSAAELVTLLLEPVLVQGRPRRYRFPFQRSERLAIALRHSTVELERLGDIDLRNSLQQIPGVGPKTASWIVRNWRASDAVAIIDIHIARAGVVAGVFDPGWSVAGHYSRFEEAFLSWSTASRVPASMLDSTIWAALSGRGTWTKEILGAAPNGNLRAVWPVSSRQ